MVNVNPIEALPVIELVEEASTRLSVEDFTLVLLRGRDALMKELGEAWTPEAEDFYALHIALEGPTIYVRLDAMDEDLLRASIYHELGHALLHGSPRYYKIPIPPPLMKLGPLAPRVLYLLAIAVKDFEVSRLLARERLAETQEPLLREMLHPEPIPWDLLQGESLILALASILKPIMFSLPLIGEDVFKFFSGAPDRLLRMTSGLSRRMGEDTIENVRLTVREFLKLVSEVS